MKQLIRLQEALVNKPQLITARSFEVILNYLDQRNSGTLQVKLANNLVPDEEPIDEIKPELAGDIGHVFVNGALSYRPVYGSCGEISGCSYMGILDQVSELIDEGAKTIVMEYATPGGQASHLFEYADNLRQLFTDSGVRSISYIDEAASSAGYGLAVVSDEVIINPSAEVGSIGCVISLLDMSKAMANAGLRRIYITSGSAKVPFEPDGSFKQSFLDELQDEATRLNNEFTAHVSKYTGLSGDVIKGLEAKNFNAEDALKIGLVNSIMKREEFTKYLTGKQ